MQNRDLDEARDAASDLLEWMNRGGFEPSWNDYDRSRFTLWCTIESVPGVGLFAHKD